MQYNKEKNMYLNYFSTNIKYIFPGYNVLFFYFYIYIINFWICQLVSKRLLMSYILGRDINFLLFGENKYILYSEGNRREMVYDKQVVIWYI